jgi:translation elongation factor EF-4
MFKRIEGLSLTRDFILNPMLDNTIRRRIEISIVVYEDTDRNEYDVVRSYYLVKSIPGIDKAEIGDTITASHESYPDKLEAFDAFSVQCVKAFTQQVVWYNGLDKEAESKGL